MLKEREREGGKGMRNRALVGWAEGGFGRVCVCVLDDIREQKELVRARRVEKTVLGRTSDPSRRLQPFHPTARTPSSTSFLLLLLLLSTPCPPSLARVSARAFLCI